jgi:hypothetical protein
MKKKYDQFAERLKLALNGVSPYAFAKVCGLADSLVRRYMIGEGLPGTEHPTLPVKVESFAERRKITIGNQQFRANTPVLFF